MANINELMEEVREGMEVHSSDGQKMGEVGDVNIGRRPAQPVTSETTAEERSFFEVRRGFLGLGDDIWLPGEVIGQVIDDRVILRYTCDEAVQRGWDTPPIPPGSATREDQGLFGL